MLWMEKNKILSREPKKKHWEKEVNVLQELKETSNNRDKKEASRDLDEKKLN